MVRRPPLSTRPDSLFPYPALFLSPGFQLAPGGGPGGVDERFTEARVEGVVAREPFAGAGVAPEVDDVSGSGGHGAPGQEGARSLTWWHQALPARRERVGLRGVSVAAQVWRKAGPSPGASRLPLPLRRRGALERGGLEPSPAKRERGFRHGY